MADGVKIKVDGLDSLKAELLKLAPDMRKGPARRALRAGAKPVLERAVAETPRLTSSIYRRGKMIRRAGTLKAALKIRSSKDVNKTGDVGVFINFKPLKRGAIDAFKEATGRPGSQNPDDPFYWRWVHFATRRNKNPKPSLTIAGNTTLQQQALPTITENLKAYFERLNRKGAK